VSMSALEHFLAKIYVDPAARARFLADPRAEAARAGLPEQQCRALEKIDRVGLEMAARSFAHKRARRPAYSPSRWRQIGQAFMGLFGQ
jgi:hypothetical protein